MTAPELHSTPVSLVRRAGALLAALFLGLAAPDALAGDGAPTVSGPLTEVGTAVNVLALDTLTALPAEGEGSLLAPANVYGVVALLAQGARGTTRERLTAALGADPATAGKGVSALEAAVSGGDGSGPVRTASGLWMARDIKPTPEFLASVGERANVRIQAADLTRPESIAAINAWIRERTEGRIDGLLPPTGSDAALIAAAAVAFKGTWQSPFDPARTKDATFLSAGADPVTVPMMSHDFPVADYRKDGEAQAVILPYAGGEIDMTIVLPAEGVLPNRDALSRWLDRTRFDARAVRLSLPRFRASAKADLAKLDGPGWVAALAMGADLTGIAANVGAVGQFHHGVTLTVDERGTEAAAASAAVVSRAFPVEMEEMVVDRPFLFFIRHRPSGAILFAGRILQPRRL